MALVIAGERPVWLPFHPWRAVQTWLAKVRAARAQREALAYLLELDHHRLADLGINRADLFDAVFATPPTTRLVAARQRRLADPNP